MLGSVAKKVAWLARATTTVVGLVIMLALVLGVASTALAGTGVGATLNLGKVNTVDAVSKLVGSVAGPSLRVDNNSAEASATTRSPAIVYRNRAVDDAQGGGWLSHWTLVLRRRTAGSPSR